jgi:hypothetical protein
LNDSEILNQVASVIEEFASGMVDGIQSDRLVGHYIEGVSSISGSGSTSSNLGLGQSLSEMSTARLELGESSTCRDIDIITARSIESSELIENPLESN